MTARQTFLSILRRTGLVLGALFLMTVLLAAMPGHRAPNVTQGAQETVAAPDEIADMPGKMDSTNLTGRRAVRRKTGVHTGARQRPVEMNSVRQSNDQ
jgi:hypothetical protein